MRILQIGMSFYPGGVERFLSNYQKAIKKYDIVFDYISMGQEIAYRNEIQREGGTIYYTRTRKHPLSMYNDIRSIAVDYDIVHINMLSAANIIPVIACKSAGVKNIVIHSHNSGTDGVVRHICHYLNKAYVNKAATARLACSELAAKWLFSREIIDNNKWKLIHNAVDLEEFRFSEYNRVLCRHELGLMNDFIVGFVGRLDPQKNLDFLIQVFYELTLIKKNTRLLIIGEGPLKKTLISQCECLKISNKVLFLGHIVDVNRYYSAFDAFCMTSHYEGLSFTAIEAQASGVKCFFSNTMARDSKILDETEFLPIDKPKKWADQLNQQKPLDRDAEHISLLMKKRNYCLDFEAQKLNDYYREQFFSQSRRPI